MNYVDVMKDFVEGRLSVSDFVSEVKGNADFRAELESGFWEKRKRAYLREFRYIISDYICTRNINLSDQIGYDKTTDDIDANGKVADDIIGKLLMLKHKREQNVKPID
ncbi:MAG: hypothetical protein LBP62_07660 [Clostridiales bacterium]|jgi:hypothetical protein|nr:hypothetical protein [Clostridiales bacterium]